jgi:hypothetical protein
MPNDLMKLVESVLAQRRAVDQKERQLIDSLNRVLPGMGYQVVPVSDARGGAPARRARRSRPSAAKALVCPQCGRSFGHPLHLGRHMAATHKGAGATPKAAVAPAKRTRATPTKAARRPKRSGKSARRKRARTARAKAA